NGSNVGTNSPVFTSNALVNHDTIVCVMTSSAACTSTSTATSAGTIMNVLSVPAAPVFSTSSDAVNQGDTGVVYAVPNNPAASIYTWSYSGMGDSIVGSGHSVTINFSNIATSGNVSVSAGNMCGTSSATLLTVTI